MGKEIIGAHAFRKGRREITIMPWMVHGRQMWHVVFRMDGAGVGWSLYPKTGWHGTKEAALEELERVASRGGYEKTA